VNIEIVQMYCSQLWVPENSDTMPFSVSSESSDTEKGVCSSLSGQPTHKIRYAAGVLFLQICVQTH